MKPLLIAALLALVGCVGSPPPPLEPLCDTQIFDAAEAVGAARAVYDLADNVVAKSTDSALRIRVYREAGRLRGIALKKYGALMKCRAGK